MANGLTKRIIPVCCTLLFLFSCAKEIGQEPDPNPVSTLTDSRDGQTYQTVKIGDLWWMAENLNTGVSLEAPLPATDNAIIEKYSYYNDTSYFRVHGGLYTWDEAMNYQEEEGVRGICPDGWHIPSEREWEELLDHYPLCSDLRAGGKSGFESLMSGSKNLYSFTGFESFGVYWSSTRKHTGYASYFLVNKSSSPVIQGLEVHDVAFSIRCVQDSIP